MKKLVISATMLERLKKVNPDIDPEKISVYEATAINTLPVVKRGSIFHGAKLTESTLKEMADYQNGGGNVPMHQLHDQSYSLPVGKVFYSEFRIENGLPEVRILFYVDNSEEVLVAKLESGTIDEVSIGFESKHMLCSECGFDFKGSEATSENFWTQTCDEGHTMGVDGVHLSLSGLENWYETSLVSRGAAKGAKIVGRAKAILGELEYNRLAATGIAPDAKILFATATPNPKAPENTMDMEKLLAQFTTLTGEAAVLRASAGTHAATLAELNGKATAAQAQVLELTGKLTKAETDLTAAQAKVTELSATPDAAAAIKLKTDAETATKALFTFATNMAVAAGGAKPAEGTSDVAALLTSIEDSKTKLAALPIGGLTQPLQQGSGTATAVQYTAAAFQSNRN